MKDSSYNRTRNGKCEMVEKRILESISIQAPKTNSYGEGSQTKESALKRDENIVDITKSYMRITSLTVPTY